jgi:hypothetical protein
LGTKNKEHRGITVREIDENGSVSGLDRLTENILID